MTEIGPLPPWLEERLEGALGKKDSGTARKPGAGGFGCIAEGERNDFLFRTLSRYRRDPNSTEPVLLSIGRALNAEQCNPPLSASEVESVVGSVLRYEPVEATRKPQHKARRLPVVWLRDVQPQLENRYLIKGVLDAGTFAVMYGASGASKTFAIVDQGLCIAAGRPWHGRRVAKGLVVYVACEGPGSLLNRVAAYRDHYLRNAADVHFCVIPAPVSLLDEAGDVADLIAAVRAAEAEAGIPCVLIIIDTLSQAMAGGDENGPKDMTQAVGSVNRIKLEVGCSVALIHHCGKDETKGGRGHSSLKAATDTELEISALSGGLYQMKATKQRDAEAGGIHHYRLVPVELGLDEDGDPVTTCVVEWTNLVALPEQRKGKVTARERILRRSLEQLFAECRGAPAPECVRSAPIEQPKPGQFVISIQEVQELFIHHLAAEPDSSDTKPDSRRKAFGRTLERAQAAGMIEVYQGYVWFTD